MSVISHAACHPAERCPHGCAAAEREYERAEIHTDYDPKPIPTRGNDWEVWRGDYDLGCLRGFGATKEQAIEDLIEKEGAA